MMRLLKKIHSISIVFFALGSLTVAPLYCYDNDIDSDNDIDVDGFDFDLDSVEDIEVNRTDRGISSQQAAQLAIFVQLLQNNPFILKPLWKSTRTINPRDVLFYTPYSLKSLKKSGVFFNTFCNITNKTATSASTLIDFGSIDDSMFATFLEGNSLIKNGSGQQIPSLFSLLNKITIQERKIGTLINGGFIRGRLSFQLHTSLQLAERNFWLNQADRDDIALILSNLFPSSNTSEINVSELYRTKCGFGDTRLKISLNALNKPNVSLDIGLDAIVPTGSLSLNKPLVRSVDELIIDIDALNKSSFNALYSIRDVLLTPNLGNHGHFGTGLFAESTIKLPHNYGSLWVQTTYTKLFANTEQRLVRPVQSITIAKLNHSFDENILVPPLSQFINEYFLPNLVSANVQPGDIITATLSYTVPIKQCTYTTGYNFYAQTKECFKSINIPQFDMNSLQLNQATNTLAYQHKLFSELSYDKKNKTSTLSVGLGGDLALASSKIGQDWTLYLRAGASF